MLNGYIYEKHMNKWKISLYLRNLHHSLSSDLNISLHVRQLGLEQELENYSCPLLWPIPMNAIYSPTLKFTMLKALA